MAFFGWKKKLDYIQEPDVFHAVFGHVPMLSDPVYSDFIQEYCRAGWKAMRYNRLNFFFFNDTATTEIYPLSLHDALPISMTGRRPSMAAPTPMPMNPASEI